MCLRSSLRVICFCAILCTLFITATAGTAGVGLTDDSARSVGPAAGSISTTHASLDPLALTNNTIVIEIDTDGDTRWQISWVYGLDTNESRAAFRQIVTEFENGEASRYLKTLDAFRNTSEQLDSKLDRQIQITNTSWSGAVSETGTNATGRLTLGFTWENFARVDGDRLVINDTLTTERHGVLLEGLSARQQLIVRIPPGYGVIDANVGVQDGALRWRGPTTFDSDSLKVTFIGAPSTPVSTPTPTPTPTPAGPSPESGLPLAGIAGVVVIALGGVAVYLGSRHRDQLPFPTGGADESQESSGEVPAVTDSQPESGEQQAQTEPDTEPETPEIDEELLSDEERVERLLEANGGRMKQADIVDKTDWSNAKVSQLLSGMEDDDRIDKLRIGRENLISFPDVDVTEIDGEE